MSQENLVICYEGLQRIYRNSIVRFLFLTSGNKSDIVKVPRSLLECLTDVGCCAA
jgi:hypothetical protein